MQAIRAITVVAIALVSVACNQQSGPRAAKSDADLYSYLPPDAVFAAGARLSHMRKSPIYERFRDRLPAEVLPYEKEASELVITSDGAHSLVLVRGKFDRRRLERDLKASDHKSAPVEFLADDLIAIGERAQVDAAKRRAGSSLAGQIPAAADVWAVTNGRLPLQPPERSNLSNLNRLGQDLQMGVIKLNLSDAIQADARFEFANEPASEQAQTALRGFIGLARLSTPDGKEQLLQVLDRIQVGREKARVVLKADWPAELVNTVLQALPAAPRSPTR